MADSIMIDLLEHLKSRLPGKVFGKSSPDYSDILQSYFSTQEANVHPSCFVRPSSAQDVAGIIEAIDSARRQPGGTEAVHFAVKSGGHTTWAGSANINHGLTIDLANLKSIDVSQDKKTTKIGPGATWSDVYSKLDPMNVTVVGGRAAQVGVGGLILGGGLSFISTRHGLASDNVVDFEVVLADGSIVHANDQTNRDLWIALKGGSNNFGIVTQFTLETFPQGQMWGGIRFSPIDIIDSQLEEFHIFAANPNYDENAVLIQSITYNSTRNRMGIANNMHYTLPRADPDALRPFWSAPSHYSTLRTTSLLDLTTELGSFSPNGKGQLYMTITFNSDTAMLRKAFDLYKTTIPVLSNVQNLFWALIFQPLPPAITAKSSNYGIDPLGLNGSPPLVLALISSSWELESDTPRVEEAARDLMSKIQQAAEKTGTAHRYIYLNYAYRGQDPIGGYGCINKAFLQKVSRDYDPHGMFQIGCPGGFKVFP